MDSFERYMRQTDGYQPGVWPDHWAVDELERVVGAERLASSPGRLNRPEWDVLRAMPARWLRRLRGAGYMRPGGMQPDQLAERIVGNVPGVEGCDEATTWYVRTALVAIDERRRERHYERHLEVARRHGFDTYYEYRNHRATWLGYRSLWDMRKEREW